MSLSCAASFLKPLADLTAGEKPYLAVRITPHATATAAARRPFHLALLIDVSGSMEGERIIAVRRTLELLVEALHDDDVLTLISYQSSAEVLAQSQTIHTTSRAGLLVAVNNLAANGGTNLEAAITALHGVTHPNATATSACAGAIAPPPVDSVFLLTDGYINQGQTAPAVLQSMLTATVPTGTPVHTLGYGADHNARMLRDIALRTRASYTYADASELLPSIVGDILGGLETEVGRCGRLLFGGEGWVCAEPVVSAGSGGHDFGTLIAGKDQWIVLEGAVGTTSGPSPLMVSWRNAAGETLTNEVVFGESDITPIQVAEQIARVSVAKGLAEAGAKLESGQRAEALAVLEALCGELTTSVAHESLLVVQLLAQVEEMLTTVRRAPSVRTGGGGAIAPLLSRMASNTAALTCQRGYVSMVQSQAPEEEEPYEPHMSAGAVGGGAATPAAPRTPSAAPYAFASPTQRTMTNTLRSRYSERE